LKNDGSFYIEAKEIDVVCTVATRIKLLFHLYVEEVVSFAAIRLFEEIAFIWVAYVAI